MRLPLLPAIILIIIGVVIDAYIYFRIPPTARLRRPSISFRSIHVAFSILMMCLVVTTVCLPRRSGSDGTLLAVMWLLYAYLTVYASKFVFIVVDLLGAIPRLWKRKRLTAFTYIGAGLGCVVFAMMWWGALINRFRIHEVDVEVVIPSLPPAFDGYRIVQISDLHVGTYGSDTSYLHRVAQTINGLSPDAIVFTGDIVNRRSDELVPHASTLAALHAPDGVYSILGNHDYGDYSDWKSPRDKQLNMDLLVDLQDGMHWKLLRNSTAWVRRGNDSLAIIGVENIGDPPFHCYGNLDASYPGKLSDDNVKILLSHNPMHWVNDIADHSENNIALTLSGHTHAMQIELAGWSPAKWRYPTWGGMYTDKSGRMLYVNIGIGAVGMPMRIGATPEITVITLRSPSAINTPHIR